MVCVVCVCVCGVWCVCSAKAPRQVSVYNVVTATCLCDKRTEITPGIAIFSVRFIEVALNFVVILNCVRCNMSTVRLH